MSDVIADTVKLTAVFGLVEPMSDADAERLLELAVECDEIGADAMEAAAEARRMAVVCVHSGTVDQRGIAALMRVGRSVPLKWMQRDGTFPEPVEEGRWSVRSIVGWAYDTGRWSDGPQWAKSGTKRLTPPVSPSDGHIPCSGVG